MAKCLQVPNSDELAAMTPAARIAELERALIDAREAICDSYQMSPWRWRFYHAQTIEAALAQIKELRK